MANNEYVNKVVYGNTTVMDITDTTATAADVVSGHDFYLKTGQKVSGSIQTKSSSDLTASGNTVTVPAGYYASQASKAVSSGTATPAATISGSSALISTGTNTITLSKTVSNVPVVSAGYISTGSTGNSDVSLTASVSVNPTPTASGNTITIPAGYYSAQTTKSVDSGSLSKGAGSVSATGTSVTLGSKTTTAPAAPYISVSGSGTVSVGTAGYLAANTSETSNSETAYYRISSLTVPQNQSFILSSQVADNSNDLVEIASSGNIAVTPYSSGYGLTYTLNTINQDGINTARTVLDEETTTYTALENGGTANYSYLKVSAYNSSGTLESNKNVVSAGKWVQNTVTPSTSAKGPYYGRTTVSAVASGSATPASTISGSSAAITTSSNSITLSKTVSNTPVVSAGYISSGTAGNSDVSLTASVTVNPTPTASGKTVTTPAGYYTAATTTDIATGSATAPASISGTSATVSTGTNTLTLTKTVSVTPSVTAGYVSSGTAGDSSVSLTANVTVDPTPTASGATVTVPAGYYSAQTTKSVDSGSLSKGAGSASATGTNVTLGAKVTGTPSLPYVTVSGSGSVSVGTAGYLAANTSETSNAETANYSITAINVPKDIAFTITSTADTAYDTSSNITLKNAAYRRASIENNGYVKIFTPYNPAAADSNTTVEITNASSGQNNVTVTNLNDYYVTVNSYDQDSNYSSQYISQGGYTYWTAQSYNVYDADLYVSAYNSSNTLETNKSVVVQGKWVQNTVTPSTSAKGPYYGRTTVSAVASGSVTAPSSISGTSATVSTGTNTLTLSKTVSVTPSVTTAGYVSSGTAGNSTVSLTASVTTKAAATITPGTTNQTIASGTYLTGTQTIAGDADLVGSNIISTANIFGVQGTVVINKYYTGSSAPSSSLGNNGDIYFQS